MSLLLSVPLLCGAFAGLSASSALSASFLPLRFEANEGQSDAEVRFLHRGASGTLFVTGSELVFLPRVTRDGEGAIRMALFGSKGAIKVTGLDPAESVTNSFIGADPRMWRTGIRSYMRLRAEEVYPGIDLIYDGRRGSLEYDFVVRPHADPSLISLAFFGAGSPRLGAKGELIVGKGSGALNHAAPVLYQLRAGSIRERVEGGFILLPGGRVGFRTGPYDHTLPLVIDPILTASSYLGGGGDDAGTAVATDSSGSIYLAGQTTSADFPRRGSPVQANLSGGTDAFVAKLDPTATVLLWTTFLGGRGLDVANGIAVDALSRVTVAGETNSTDFPTTPSGFQLSNRGGSDAFVTRLDASGSSLLYSTYLGGSGNLDRADAVALDPAGNLYVTGRINSLDFPSTPGAFQTFYRGGDFDAFLAKIDSSLSGAASLVYSSFLGGSQNDAAFGVAIDTAGEAFVTGGTRSPDFPTTPTAFQSANLSTDAFVLKLSAAGSVLLYGTLLGGSNIERGNAIVVDGAGNVFVTGTTSSTDFPVRNAAQAGLAGGTGDAFVARLNPAGSGLNSLVFATYLGGAGDDRGNALTLDAGGGVAVAGQTDSSDFPSVLPFQSRYGGGLADAFLARYSPAGLLLDSTFFGGSGDDRATGVAAFSGALVLTGRTGSSNFPSLKPFQPTSAGGADAFVARFRPGVPVIVPASFAIPVLSPTALLFLAVLLGLAGLRALRSGS